MMPSPRSRWTDVRATDGLSSAGVARHSVQSVGVSSERIRVKNTIYEIAKTLIPIFVLSGLGGIVRLLNTRGLKFSVGRYLAGISTAVFAGVVLHYLMLDFSVPMGLRHACIAIVGYVSRDFLEIVSDRLLKKIKSKHL